MIKDYETSISRRTHKVDFISCLNHSARQFVVRRPDGGTEIIAGYPWYGVNGREFDLAPGVDPTQGYERDCIDVLDTIIRYNNEGKLDRSFDVCQAVDPPLWFFRVLQELEPKLEQSKFGHATKGLSQLFDYYRSEECTKIEIHDNGLLWTWSDDNSLTWMDTTIHNESGLAVMVTWLRSMPCGTMLYAMPLVGNEV